MAAPNAKDPLGAFVPGPRIVLDGAPAGPLAGLTFAVKDIYDIAGHVTGCGNPDWLATHAPAERTAPAVEALLGAGARMVGKTITDEIAFSLNGENHWYGTPLNPAAPDRIPGGSSSGSVSAVAGGAVDFALGSDTGGSVRAPASFCGIFGLRSSHGLIPLDGIMPLAPSFDTVGWFARDAATLRRVGDVLLDAAPAPAERVRPLLAEEAFALAEPTVRAALEPALRRVETVLGRAAPVRLSEHGLDAWRPHFQALQWREVWQSHGAWITAAKPRFGPILADRFAAVSQVPDAAVQAAEAFRAAMTARLAELLAGGAVLVMPTVPRVALPRNQPSEMVVPFRNQCLDLLCVAGLCRLPQLSLPLAVAEGCPVGLSLVGARGADRTLLALAERVAVTAQSS